MRLLVCILILCTIGCASRVVRDSRVYETEVDFTNKIVTTSSKNLKLFWKGRCSCTSGKWGALMGAGLTNAQCQEAGDIVLMVDGNRWKWHHIMARINAGWDVSEIKDVPSWFDPSNPPEIPPLSTLCEEE